MDHEQASLLIPDLVAGRLAGEQAAAVERHLGECAGCRDTAALHRSFRGEIESFGEHLFSDHPPADLLVAFALASARVGGGDSAPIGAHVRACPTCQVEVASIRGAESRADAWWQGLAEALRQRELPGPIPALVPALLVLLFVYPAYLGVVRLPQVRLEREKALEEIEALRDNPPGAGSWTGGPVSSLTLPSDPRGGGDTLSTPIPAVRLRAGQTFQPVRIAVEPFLWPADRIVVVTLRAAAAPAGLWSLRARVADLWDAADEAINLLVPVTKLKPGDYVVEIGEPEATAPGYSARFRIVE